MDTIDRAENGNSRRAQKTLASEELETQLSLLENEMRRVERVNVSKLSIRWNFDSV